MIILQIIEKPGCFVDAMCLQKSSGLEFEISNFLGDKIELKQKFSILFGHIISDLKSEFRDLKISGLKIPTSDFRLKVGIL